MSDDEPILDALPAGAPAKQQGPTLPLTQEARKLIRSHRIARLAPQQRAVFALFVRGTEDYRNERIVAVISYCLIPFLLAVGFALSLAFMCVFYWILVVASWRAGPNVLNCLYAAPILAAIIGRGMKANAEERAVAFMTQDGLVDGFALGRLHEFLAVLSGVILSLFLGACIGFQVGLLYFLPDHCGLALQGGFWECCLVTFDNTCNGVFLDTFELYDLQIGPNFTHNKLSATVFYAFRLSFDALVILFLWEGYHRYKLRTLFWGFPYDPRDIDEFLYWLDGCCSEPRFARLFYDEFTFFLLVKEYLSGNYVFVETLSQQLPWLRVKPEVRELFRDDDGRVLFTGTFDPDAP